GVKAVQNDQGAIAGPAPAFHVPDDREIGQLGVLPAPVVGMAEHVAQELHVLRGPAPNHRPESRVGRMATVRGYEPGDLEWCRGLWVELTQWHRDIFDSPGIGGDNPGLAFDEHLAKVGAENIWVAEDNG